MRITGEQLKTKRNHARFGDIVLIGDKPVALVKSGKKEDILTPEEFVEALYKKPVDHINIVFKEETPPDL